MRLSPLVPPALGATALAIALLGATVAAIGPHPASTAIVAQDAVAPTPLVLDDERAQVAQRKAHARAAAVAAAQERVRAQQRASRARRAAAAAAADPRAVARELLAARGQAGQFGCLDRLWTKESEWRVRATNPSSGAYGIPQSLPAGKMASAGADWRTNPRTQIRWGLDYISERYGSPCAAWAHSQARNWY
jgi:hypothetical protein